MRRLYNHNRKYNNIISSVLHSIYKWENKIFIILFTAYVMSVMLGVLITNMPGVHSLSEPLIIVYMRRSYFVFILLVSLRYMKIKVFHNKAVYVLMIGLFAWLLLGLFATATGLTLSQSDLVYREIFSLLLFYGIYFLTARFIIIRNLLGQALIGALFSFGTMIATAYIMNFDGFAFLNPDTLKSMFLSQGRYRYAFGLGHVVAAGIYSYNWLAFFSVYKLMLKDKKDGGWGLKRIWLIDKYFTWVCCPIAILILLSSCTRSMIISILLLWIVFYWANNYQKMSIRLKILYIMSCVLIFIMILLVIFINWDFVLQNSNRELNYTLFPWDLMTQKISYFLCGLGFMRFKELTETLGMPYLDGIFVMVYARNGLIGCIIYFWTFFYFAFLYFKSVNKFPTKVHKMCLGFVVIYLFNGLWGSDFFGHSAISLITWLLMLVCINEIRSRKRKFSYHSRPVLQ